MKRNNTFRKIFSLAAAASVVCAAVPFVPAVSAASTDERYTVLVLDTSNKADFLWDGSVFFTADTALEDVKTASAAFLDNIEQSNGTDHIALVSFKNTASKISDFTDDYNSLKEKINAFSASSNTRDIAAGLNEADKLLDQITDENAIKNVVLFTTGMTNEGSYSYDGFYGEETIASNWHRIDTGVNLYAFANKAIEASQNLRAKGVNIYTIGLFKSMEDMPEQGRDIAEFFRITAKDLAGADEYFKPVEDPKNLGLVFGEVADNITTSYYELEVESSGGAADPTLEGDANTVAAGSEIPLKAVPDEGKVFVRWEADDGVFADPTSPTTTFTMPEQNVVIRAIFADITTTAETTTTTAESTTTTTTTVTTTTTTTTAAPAANAPAQKTTTDTSAVKTGDADMAIVFTLMLSGLAAAGLTAKRRRDAE